MIEVNTTDRIGDLNAEQIQHLSVGLEHAHDMTLKNAGGGRYWLEVLDGGALLVRPNLTVAEVWDRAAAIYDETSNFSIMPQPTLQTFAEILRASTLPPDAAVALELAAPGHHVATAAEIQSVQRGEIPPVRPEFDQINAVLAVLYLRYALRQLGADNDAGRVVQKLAWDLQSLVAADCPNLASVLRDGIARDAQIPKVTAQEIEWAKADSRRMDWLQNAFLGGDTAAGGMIGLPGNWTTLRTEVDRAIEEGR